jgi:hypothetical protein
MVGCQQQKSAVLKKPIERIDLHEAIRLALGKAEEVTSFQDRDFDLMIRNGENGWRFLFWFKPEKPGDFFYDYGFTRGKNDVYSWNVRDVDLNVTARIRVAFVAEL